MAAAEMKGQDMKYAVKLQKVREMDTPPYEHFARVAVEVRAGRGRVYVRAQRGAQVGVIGQHARADLGLVWLPRHCVRAMGGAA